MDIGPNSNKILHSIMSSSSSTSSNAQSINVNSVSLLVHSNRSSYTVYMAHVTYQCLQVITDSIRSHIDGGANGGLADADIHMHKYNKKCADITGVGQASITTLPLVACAGTVHTTQGPSLPILRRESSVRLSERNSDSRSKSPSTLFLELDD